MGKLDRKVPMRTAGGSATGSGINYQVAVTAIAAIHIASGERLSWLDGVVNDTPTKLAAETGGAGDDLAITFSDGSVAEIQIKRGLTRGDRLWPALMKLSTAIANSSIKYGVLIVSPDSSRTIGVELANDIQRIGDGQFSGLKDIAVDFRGRLESAGLSAQDVCKGLRVHTVNCLDVDAASIVAARAILRNVCSSADQISAAWDALYRDSAKLVELRGYRTAESVYRVLRSAEISIRDYATRESPLALIEKLTKITLDGNNAFSIFGIKNPLPLDAAWIPLRMIVQKREESTDIDIGKAVARYHAWDTREYSRDADEIDPETIGRFVHHSVVCAGPGMGKSTYLRKVARIYASDGYGVLLVRLPFIAARIKETGSTFEEAVFAHGLDSSGITAKEAIDTRIREWVLLCDGLDECGSEQESVCQGILNFVRGRPECRLIVTTRPIGYTSTLLANWRHYELLSMEPNSSTRNIEILLSGVVGLQADARQATLEFAEAQLNQNESSKVVSRSPLLMGFAVSLAIKRIDFGRTKTQLFERLFQLIDEAPNSRKASEAMSKPVLLRFLNILGWVLVNNTATLSQAAVDECANIIAIECELQLLKAKVVCDECLRYWEAVGIVERLRHAGDETLTFVHKTFGEYAAARYLRDLSPKDRMIIIESSIDDRKNVEVFTFAASFGLADEILGIVLTGAEKTESRLTATKRAIELMNISETPPNNAIRAKIFDLAIEFIKSPDRSISTSIAEELLIACDRFEAEISVHAITMVAHHYPWTRLASLAFLTRGKNNVIDLNKLKKEFAELDINRLMGGRSSLTGGFVLENTGKLLIETVALYAVDKFLTELASLEAEALIRDFLKKYDPHQDYKFVSKVKKLLIATDLENVVSCLSPRENHWAQIFGSEEYRAEVVSSERKVLGSLKVGLNLQSAPPIIKIENELIHLNFSAFLAASENWRDDTRDWKDAFDTDAVKETWRVFIKVAKIQEGDLALEVQQLLLDLETEAADEYRLRWCGRTVAVDIQVDWERAREIDMDLELLERALNHDSSWVVVNAAQMLGHKLSHPALLSLVERVFTTGKDEALWAAAAIGVHADKVAATQLAYARLIKPLASGSIHLFALLEDAGFPLTPDMLTALRNGLLYGPLTANAAMKVADQFALHGNKELDKLLAEAYQYWQKHEQPYPEHGGAIPLCPRAKIMAARLKIGCVTTAELLAAVSDAHSELVSITTPAFLQRLSTDEYSREMLIVGTEGADLKPNLLAAAISQDTPFSDEQCERICQLMKHDKPRVRFAAMSLLKPFYVQNATIEFWAKSLLNDAEEEIRKRAHSLLSSLGGSG
jgi:NACHT domain